MTARGLWVEACTSGQSHQSSFLFYTISTPQGNFTTILRPMSIDASNDNPVLDLRLFCKSTNPQFLYRRIAEAIL